MYSMCDKFVKIFCVIYLTISGSHASDRKKISYGENPMNWTDAFNWCSERNASLPSDEDIVKYKLNTNVSIWSNMYIVRTKYVTNLGCAKLEYDNRDGHRIFPAKKLNAPYCFFKCQDYLEKNSKFFALKDDNCVCLKEHAFTRKFSLGCLHTCFNTIYPCGGKDTHTLFRVEHNLFHNASSGWCGAVKYPFSKIELMSCSKHLLQTFCKLKKGNSIDFKKVPKLEWTAAQRFCSRNISHGSNFTMMSLDDFNDTSLNTSKEEYYWIATRIYQQSFKTTDIFVEQKYHYECSLYEKQKTKKDIGCKHKHRFYCLKDPAREKTNYTTVDPAPGKTNYTTVDPAPGKINYTTVDPAREKTNYTTVDPAQDKTNYATVDPAPEKTNYTTVDPAPGKTNYTTVDPAPGKINYTTVDPAREKTNYTTVDPAQDKTNYATVDPAPEKTNYTTVDPAQEKTNYTSLDQAQEKTTYTSVDPATGKTRREMSTISREDTTGSTNQAHKTIIVLNTSSKEDTTDKISPNLTPVLYIIITAACFGALAATKSSIEIYCKRRHLKKEHRGTAHIDSAEKVEAVDLVPESSVILPFHQSLNNNFEDQGHNYEEISIESCANVHDIVKANTNGNGNDGVVHKDENQLSVLYDHTQTFSLLKGYGIEDESVNDDTYDHKITHQNENDYDITKSDIRTAVAEDQYDVTKSATRIPYCVENQSVVSDPLLTDNEDEDPYSTIDDEIP